jgi:hypothetical protein
VPAQDAGPLNPKKEVRVPAMPVVQKRRLVNNLRTSPERLVGEPDTSANIHTLGYLDHGSSAIPKSLKVSLLVIHSESEDKIKGFVGLTWGRDLLSRRLEVQHGQVPAGKVFREVCGTQHEA